MAEVLVLDQERDRIRPVVIQSVTLEQTGDGRNCVLAYLKPFSKHHSPVTLASPKPDQPDIPDGYDDALTTAIAEYAEDPAERVELESAFVDGAWEWMPTKLYLLEVEP
ncbi:hypothetical protein ACLQ2P_41785 [Actinomadura citrea]|uniref:hypothetical protein n=1 Tax=Actinomadura citrea TaxID=46158 RepID=UPI003CE47120